MKNDDFKTISVYLHKDNIKCLDEWARENRILSRSSALNILLSQLFGSDINENKK